MPLFVYCMQGLPDARVTSDRPDQLETADELARLETSDVKVHQVHLDPVVTPDLLDERVPQDLVDQKVEKDHEDSWDVLAPPVAEEARDLLAALELREDRATLVCRNVHSHKI